MKTPTALSLVLPLVVCAALAAPQVVAAQEQAGTPSTMAAAGNAVAATPAPAKRKRGSTVITAEEIAEINATNAYEAVSRLRANWLRKRGVASINREGSILVYQDGMRYGTPESLRQINASGVESITFLDGVQATQRFGIGHGNGAIIVNSRR